MIPYFSGIASDKEYQLLETAKVTYLLTDQFDLIHVPQGRSNVALDCGAYKLMRRGKVVEIKPYVKVAESRDFTMRIAPDVIGDAEQTLKNWMKVRRRAVEFTPVYQWGAPADHLKRYLDEAATVAIGGLVKLMHEHETPEQKKARDRMLKELTELCDAHQGRLHILGGNWLHALNKLKDLAASYDSSKWISSAGKGRIVFINKRYKTPFIAIAPQRVIKQNGVAIYADLDREGRAILNARNIEEYFLRRAHQEKQAA